MAFKIEKKTKVKIGVPTASLPDIIFQLLIFFMVSTVLREYTGLKVDLPEAVKIQKLPSRQHVSTIWVDKLNNIVIDDVTVRDVANLQNIAMNKLNEDKQLVFSLKVDVEADMGRVIDVQQALRKANGLRINYSAIPAAP